MWKNKRLPVIFLLVISLSGCFKYTTQKDLNAELQDGVRTQNLNKTDFGIVLLYNPKPVKVGGGHRRTPFSVNINDRLTFNEKFNETELRASLCAIKHAFNDKFSENDAALYVHAMDNLIQRFLSGKGVNLPVLYDRFYSCNNPLYSRMDLLPVTSRTMQYWQAKGTLSPHRMLTSFSWNDLHAEFLTAKHEQKELEDEYAELERRYENLTESDPKDLTGSLFVKVNTSNYTWDLEAQNAMNRFEDRHYPQNICALTSESRILRPTIGYRAFGKEILSDPLGEHYRAETRQMQAELKITGNGGPLSFFESFDSLNEAYSYFTNLGYGAGGFDWSEHCVILVGPARKIAKLNDALTDDGIRTAYGRLLLNEDTLERAAHAQGYESHNEFQFVIQEEMVTERNQLQALRQYGVNSAMSFDELKDEIRSAEYTKRDLSLSVILAYLADRQAARNNGTDIKTEKNERLARQAQQQRRQEEIAANRQAQMEKNFPYIATLSCEFQGNHINIAACFVGGEYSKGTQLRVDNGRDSQIYQAYELLRAGKELPNGLQIDLRESFYIQAQNASDDLSLRLQISKREGGGVVFENIVSQYGVVRVGN
jgi:DNA-binding transcriptional MerR regulator